MTDLSPKPLWEDQGPFFRRLYNTWKESVFHPIRFFQNMPVDAGIGKPYLYFLITSFIGTLATAIWMTPICLMIAMSVAVTGAGWTSVIGIIVVLAAMVLISPILSTIWIFIMAGFFHLGLMIFGGNKKGIEATFRSLAYGTGSGAIGNLVPFFGAFAGLWAIVLTIIGFKESHQITTAKAILAYLVPLFLCVCLATAMYMFFIFAAILNVINQVH